MESALPNKSITLRIDLVDQGNFKTPDEDSVVTYSVYGHDGKVLEGFDSVEVIKPEGGYPNSFDITLPPEINVLRDGEKLEYRTLVVFYVSEGANLYERKRYRVCDIPPYTCTRDDVRLVFGLNDTDIPDELIDLDNSYFDLILSYPSLESHFVGYGVNRSKVNRLLALSCALSFSNSLPLMAVGSESDGTSKMSRFESALDFEKQISNAKSEYEKLLGELDPEEDTSNISFNFFNVVTTEDIFTGS